MREVTEEEFNERKRLSEERRAAKQQAATDRAEAIANGEQVEPILRNGRQGKGEWVNGVYFMDDFDPQEYLRIVAQVSSPKRDPDVEFIKLLSAKFPHLAYLEKEDLLTAACSILFDHDPDMLLSRACQMLESLQGMKSVPCGTLVSRYRRQPEISGSTQSLKMEDL
jgi:hypothetical protein